MNNNKKSLFEKSLLDEENFYFKEVSVPLGLTIRHIKVPVTQDQMKWDNE